MDPLLSIDDQDEENPSEYLEHGLADEPDVLENQDADITNLDDNSLRVGDLDTDDVDDQWQLRQQEQEETENE